MCLNYYIIKGCFLQLMALNESTIISDDEINTFIDPIKPDIRQSIIQLQYVLSTGRIDQVTFILY